jgi:hypothetical protein
MTYVVNIFGEFVCRPFLLAVQCLEAELVDRVTVISCVLSFNHRVVAVDSHCSVVMRDQKGKDFPVQFHLMTNESEELHNSSYGESRYERSVGLRYRALQRRTSPRTSGTGSTCSMWL